MAALTLGLAGCSEQERSFFQAFCNIQPNTCNTFSPSDQTPVERFEASIVLPNQGPIPLQTWMNDRSMSDEAESASLSNPDATFVTIAGGLRPTGGYRMEVSEAVRAGDNWVIEARVVTPDPGSMVTMAMTNPTTPVQFPNLDGKIQVRLTGAPGAGNGYQIIQSMQVFGIVAQSDAQVKEDGF